MENVKIATERQNCRKATNPGKKTNRDSDERKKCYCTQRSNHEQPASDFLWQNHQSVALLVRNACESYHTGKMWPF